VLLTTNVGAVFVDDIGVTGVTLDMLSMLLGVYKTE